MILNKTTLLLIFKTSLAILFLTSCKVRDTTKLPVEKTIKKKVLLIGFDGIRTDAFNLLLKNGNLPNMKKLIDKGVYFDKATTSDLSGSWGGWSDVLRGVHRDKHEAGYWGQNIGPSPDLPEFIAYPDLFTRLETYNSNLNTISFISWEGLNNSLNSADKRYFYNYNDDGDELLTAKAIEELKEANHDVIFFYQADTDIDGHNHGFGPNKIATSLEEFSSKYKNSIINADFNAGKVLSAIETRDAVKKGEEKWMVLFTSDHGGTNGGHSQNRIAERNIPIIISGINFEISKPTFDKSIIDVQPKNIDILPTIFDYLEIPRVASPWKNLDGNNIMEILNLKRVLDFDTNLVFNGDAEYDVGFNGQDETIQDGGSKAGERDWPTEGVYWDQAISGWDDWTETPSRNSMTVAYYGSGDHNTLTYPQKEMGAKLNGGKNFFTSGIDGYSIMEQSINVSNLINQRHQAYELSAYLGGSKDIAGSVNLSAVFLDTNGSEILTDILKGPSASDRNNTTKLLYKSKSGHVPPNTKIVKIRLEVNGTHGFADNISFMIKN